MNAMMEVETLSNGGVIRVARAKRRPAPVIELQPERTKARDSSLIYARNRLLAWSKWAKENRQELGCPTISSLFRHMQATKVGVIRGHAYPVADKHGVIHYPINAQGKGTQSFRPQSIGEVPIEFLEVDVAVAEVPAKPREVGIAHYFTYGPLEERVKETPYKRARYLQLLESFEYSVYVALKANRTF